MGENVIETFRLVDDNGDCEHRFIVGPQRKIKNLYVGHCDECRQEVALEIDKNDERTGRSWIIEYGSAIAGNRTMARPVDPRERHVGKRETKK
ncbi:MAG TPA: hypothetical protein VKT29_16325 [Terriglobales bacterium]|nr:hypothetical protein [Terriglobales bacterium]